MNYILDNLKRLNLRNKEIYEDTIVNSIAVVGNSNILTKQRPSYGSYIDEHRFVIRCNLAPADKDGWSFWVGKKSSLRVVNCHVIKTAYSKCADWYHEHMKENFESYKPKQLYRVVQPGEIVLCKDKVTSEEAEEVSWKLKQLGASLQFIDDEQMSIIKSINESPTTGFIATLYAMQNAHYVNLFGFSFYEQNSGHYYERVKAKDQSASHNLVHERHIINVLEEEGMLKVFK